MAKVGRKPRKFGSITLEDISNAKKGEIKESVSNMDSSDEIKPEKNVDDFNPEKHKNFIDMGYNPFTEKPVDEKSYSLGEMPSSGSSDTYIPEQEFTPPPATDDEISDVPFEDIPKGGSSKDSEETQSREEFEVKNDISSADKKQGAKMLADVILRSYQAYVPKLYVMIGSISDKKINQLRGEGKIRLDLPMETSMGTKTNVAEIFDSLNSQLAATVAVSEEWIEDVRKPLERVLAKKEVGLTDEGYLLIKVAEHNIQCITGIISLKSQVDSLIEHIIVQTAKYEASMASKSSVVNNSEMTDNKSSKESKKEDIIEPTPVSVEIIPDEGDY